MGLPAPGTRHYMDAERHTSWIIISSALVFALTAYFRVLRDGYDTNQQKRAKRRVDHV